jgi:lipoprotein NlpI
MYLAKFFRAGIVLASLLVSQNISAQPAPGQQLKEVQVESSAFTLSEPIPSWVDATPLPEVTKPQPIVIRLMETQFMVGPTPVTYVRRAMAINDAASLTAAGRFSISFAPEYERVQLHWVRIQRAQELLDRTKSSNIRFLQREQGLENGVYSGHVTASILIDDLRVGDTLDIAYSTSGQNPVFGGKYFGLSIWDQSLPTLQRRVVLNHPVGRSIQWRMVGDRASPELVPGESVRDGMRRLDFRQENLSEIVGEAQTAPDFFGYRFLQFSEFKSWNEVAGWASTLFDVKPAIGEDLRIAVDRIRPLGSDQQRVMSALEFVQSQIRYFSVSLGESSHRPAAPDEVLRRRYGDCKDKSFLLVTLLRELGIESSPVLLQIGRREGIDKTLPSPQFFDHAIVRAVVDGQVYFLDPTRLGQHGLLNRMGQAHSGAQVLVVNQGTTDLTSIPGTSSDLVEDEIAERITLAKFGDEGQLELKRVLSGLTAERTRVVFELSSHDRILRSFGDAMERRYPGASMVGEPTIADDPVNNTFTIGATYRIPKLATERDGNWLVYFRPDNFVDILTTSSSANRTTPLRIAGYPFHGKYNVEITFPETVSDFADPLAQTVQNRYFSATLSESFRGNTAKRSMELTTLRASVEPDKYAAYADDVRAFSKAVSGLVFVSKLAIKSGDPSDQSSFNKQLQGLSEQTIKKATETIAGGKLTGADLADAYCLRGQSYAELDRYDEAIQDTSTAVRLAPNSSGPLICRGEIYFRTGQFDKSIADYSKAIPLGATMAGTFRGRGVSRLFAGLVEEAVADLTKASELADKETRVYCDIWLAIAYARLGKPAPTDLVKRATTELRGEWPRPALAMIAGAMTPDDVIKSVDDKKGDERQMALAEGYFYVGEYYLTTGDKKAAQTYFDKTREIGVIMYIEHIAAGLELARLKGENSAATITTAPRQAAP